MTLAHHHLHRRAGTSFTKVEQQRGVQMRPVVSNWSQKTTRAGFFA